MGPEGEEWIKYLDLVIERNQESKVKSYPTIYNTKRLQSSEYSA